MVFYIFISKAPLLRFSFFLPLESRPLLSNCSLLLHKPNQCKAMCCNLSWICFQFLFTFSRMVKCPEMTRFTFRYYIIMQIHRHFFPQNLTWNHCETKDMWGGGKNPRVGPESVFFKHSVWNTLQFVKICFDYQIIIFQIYNKCLESAWDQGDHEIK